MEEGVLSFSWCNLQKFEFLLDDITRDYPIGEFVRFTDDLSLGPSHLRSLMHFLNLKTSRRLNFVDCVRSKRKILTNNFIKLLKLNTINVLLMWYSDMEVRCNMSLCHYIMLKYHNYSFYYDFSFISMNNNFEFF